MFIKWYKAKKTEIELKLALYTYAAGILNEKAELIELIGRIYASVKDTPTDRMQEQFIKELALLAHEAASSGKQSISYKKSVKEEAH